MKPPEEHSMTRRRPKRPSSPLLIGGAIAMASRLEVTIQLI